MVFSYLKHVEFQDTLDIEDVGNVVLDVLNDDGQEWVLKVSTHLGYTQIIQAGPFIADSDEISSFFYFSAQEIEYNERTLFTTINKFINDDKKSITQIFFISKEEVAHKLNSIDKFQIVLGK